MATKAAQAALKIVSKKAGFRRAGRVWTDEATVLLSALTETQIKQLHDEPMLIVTEVSIDPKSETETENGK